MAEAYGKLTGRPGICLVTRGPGATHASVGIHTAFQDSTPMLLFVGQVAREQRDREAFQEVDLRAMFRPLAKQVFEIDDAARIPELISRAFHVATSGRPGPVVIGLPEDMQRDDVDVPDAAPFRPAMPVAGGADLARLRAMLAEAERPLIIAGGSIWSQSRGRRPARLRRGIAPARASARSAARTISTTTRRRTLATSASAWAPT